MQIFQQPIWVTEMFQEAKTRDKQLANAFTKDFAIERNIFLFCCTIVLTLLSENCAITSICFKKLFWYSNRFLRRLPKGLGSQRLSYRRVNALSSGELKNALKSRGIVVGKVTIRKRRRLRQAVTQKTSFRRPWSYCTIQT